MKHMLISWDTELRPIWSHKYVKTSRILALTVKREEKHPSQGSSERCGNSTLNDTLADTTRKRVNTTSIAASFARSLTNWSLPLIQASTGTKQTGTTSFKIPQQRGIKLNTGFVSSMITSWLNSLRKNQLVLKVKEIAYQNFVSTLVKLKRSPINK